MYKAFAVLLALATIASATKVQSYTGTLYGQWSNTCSKEYTVGTGSNLVITNQNDTNLMLNGSNFLGDIEWNCTYTANTLNQPLYVNGFIDYNNADINSDEGQFSNLTCSSIFTFSDSQHPFVNTSITAMALNGGALFNFQDDTDCSVFLTETSDYDATQLSITSGDPQDSSCSTFEFQGETSIYGLTNDETVANTGSVHVNVTTLNGTYVVNTTSSTSGSSSSDNTPTVTDTASDASFGCKVSYLPQYPSAIISVEDCLFSDSTADVTVKTSTDLTVTFLDNGNALVNDQSETQCFQTILGQAVLFVSSALAFLVAFVNIL